MTQRREIGSENPLYNKLAFIYRYNVFLHTAADRPALWAGSAYVPAGESSFVPSIGLSADHMRIIIPKLSIASYILDVNKILTPYQTILSTFAGFLLPYTGFFAGFLQALHWLFIDSLFALYLFFVSSSFTLRLLFVCSLIKSCRPALFFPHTAGAEPYLKLRFCPCISCSMILLQFCLCISCSMTQFPSPCAYRAPFFSFAHIPVQLWPGHQAIVSSTSAWAIPGTLIPSLKLVLLSRAPVGMNSTFFQFLSCSCLRI